MTSPRTITDTIKELAAGGKSVGFKLDTFTVPLKLADKKAIEIIDMLLEDPELPDPFARMICGDLDIKVELTSKIVRDTTGVV